jgi:hypothetical protein
MGLPQSLSAPAPIFFFLLPHGYSGRMGGRQGILLLSLEDTAEDKI